MSQQDDDLLKPLQNLSPSDLQLQKWQTAVQAEVRRSKTVVTTAHTQWAMQLVAAMLAGVLIGAFTVKAFFSGSAQSPLVAQVSFDNATIEHSHTNLD